MDIEVEVLFREIEAATGLTRAEIKAKNRKRIYIHARRVFCVILRRYTPLSQAIIANYIKQDHATVINHLKMHDQEVDTYRDYGNLYKTIYSKVEAIFIAKTYLNKNFYFDKIELLKKTIKAIENEIVIYQQKIESLKSKK